MRIPKDKFDVEALDDFDLLYLLEHQSEILVWLQDYNWPIAKVLSKLIQPYILDLEDSIIEILKSNDLEWKCNIIGAVIYYANRPSENIISELKRIYSSPVELEEVKDECEEVLNKFSIQY